MYRTLKQDAGGVHAGPCPTCGAETRVRTLNLEVLARCLHLVRRWRVSADGRVRVEYRAAVAEVARA